MDFHQRGPPQKPAGGGAGGWGATMRAAGGKTTSPDYDSIILVKFEML